MLDIAKLIGSPGSVTFLAGCFAFGLVLTFVWPRNWTLGSVWFLFVFATYVILSVPLVASGIASALSTAPLRAWSGSSVDILVLLGGDNARGRVSESARLIRLSHPRLVYVSGERWFVDALIEAGVPSALIKHETVSRNTREQIAWIESLVKDRPGQRVVVVASRLHMPRVEQLVKASRRPIELAVSPVDAEPPSEGARRFLPTYTALRISRDALYEHAALVYYRLRGWTNP